jgi:hypothetical protein
MRLVPIFFASLLIGLLLIIIFGQVKEHHLQDDQMIHTLRNVLKPVHPIVETLRFYKGDKSYTINKEKVFLCLKDENGEYYPLNMLVYVTLHEIAHVLNNEDVGHTENFHNQFDKLLDKAGALGIFNHSIPIIQNYCGGGNGE